MSRDGGEHGEDQAAEHQDEPENNERERDILILERHRHHWMGWHLQLSRPACPHLQRFRKMHQSQQCADWEARLCFFLCDKLLNPSWHWRRTRTTWQQSHRADFLSAVNHEPDHFSISWDIKLIVIVCVPWFRKTQAAKRTLLENKRHPTAATLHGNVHFFPPSHKSSRNTLSFETQTWGLRF